MPLEEALSTAPVLVLPDISNPFTIVCDASDYGVGAVLLQHNRVTANSSAILNSAEQNYCATERNTRNNTPGTSLRLSLKGETLAGVKALKEWTHYVFGKEVTMLNDRKCNTYLL